VIYLPSKSKKRSRKKISSGTKNNLDTIISEISIITGRKNLPKDDPTEAITDAFAHVDAHIAAIGLALPDVDVQWRESGARAAFIKIKKRRRFLIRFLISLFVLFSISLVAGSIVAIFFWDHWARWVIVLAAVLVLFFGSTYVSKIITGPFISKRDANIPIKYEKECKLINEFVTELVQIIRK